MRVSVIKLPDYAQRRWILAYCGNVITIGSPHWKLPELFFEKKELIPSLQQLIVSQSGHC